MGLSLKKSLVLARPPGVREKYLTAKGVRIPKGLGTAGIVCVRRTCCQVKHKSIVCCVIICTTEHRICHASTQWMRLPRNIQDARGADNELPCNFAFLVFLCIISVSTWKPFPIWLGFCFSGPKHWFVYPEVTLWICSTITIPVLCFKFAADVWWLRCEYWWSRGVWC